MYAHADFIYGIERLGVVQGGVQNAGLGYRANQPRRCDYVGGGSAGGRTSTVTLPVVGAVEIYTSIVVVKQ